MTVIGLHTVQETRDLIRATEFRVNKNVQQLQRVQAQRLQPPTAAQNQLDADMATFVRRWVDVRDKQTLIMVAAVLANPSVAPFLLPAEAQYVAIDNATRRDTPRLGDIQARIGQEAAILALPPVNLDATPPQNSPDADFAALRKLDATIKAGEDAANSAKKGVGSALSSNTGLLVLGGVGIALAGVVAVKVYL